jgi:hypothetical protein
MGAGEPVAARASVPQRAVSLAAMNLEGPGIPRRGDWSDRHGVCAFALPERSPRFRRLSYALSMHIQKSLAALAVASLALSPLASAEDARITCTGTVASVDNGGVGSQPFANAAVGEAITIVFDVEIARQLPFGDYLYLVNSPSSSVAIGAASDGLAFSILNTFTLRNDFGQLGDVFALDAQLASNAATRFQLFLVNIDGQALNTQDVRDLYGTSLALGSFQVAHFAVYGPTGSLSLTVSSVAIDAAPGGVLGTPYCTAVPNSTGAIGITSAFGLQTPGDNDLTLTASGLPNGAFGYFLVSADQSFIAGAGGSAGNLCLGGAVGRFVGQDQVMQADFGGEIALPVDLRELPSPTGSQVVQAGQTWNFQLWHRDALTTGQSSNFTRALELSFQ